MGNSFIVKQLIEQCGLLVFPVFLEEIEVLKKLFLTWSMVLLKDIVFVCLFKPLNLLSQMMQVVTINERSMRSKAISFSL